MFIFEIRKKLRSVCACVVMVGRGDGWGIHMQTALPLPLHYHQSACISLFVCLPINLCDCLSFRLIDQLPGGRDRSAEI